MMMKWEPGRINANSGVPYGLPTLSLIEKLFLSVARLHCICLKLVDIDSCKVSMKGHWIATPTNIKEAHSIPRRLVVDETGDNIINVIWVGSFDKWERIVQRKSGGRCELTALNPGVFPVCYNFKFTKQ
jgi:hypothetical protein